MNPYFDHNATTPMSRAAREAWWEASERWWHNPSSLYREAGTAKRLLEDAREELADLLGIDLPERVIFTGGATESNQAVMRYAVEAATAGSMAMISEIEHPSLREPALREFGQKRIEEISVSGKGAVDADEIEERLRQASGTVALVSVMAANNETGVMQPWQAVASHCRSAGVGFHCDAAQWIGKLPASQIGEACDFVIGSAHKFGGPKGVGFLTIPDSAVGEFRSSVGGPQEHGHRAGTENLPGILAMMAALRERNDEDLTKQMGQWLEERTRFEESLQRALPGAKLVGDGADRLWNTVMLVLPGGASNL
ncbi:MAG: aminotransferase class V-fold PLP-dependent enzyme, partial [Verrucomicrobiae bacterium]|nr:aminotransferase class V-fold PLP-dependent enzyme [Verrucomicrobiae bacterium]